MKKESKNVSLIVQAILLFALTYFLIISFIIPDTYIIVEIIMSLLFINLAYSSYKMNQKKKSIVYIIFSIFILVITVLDGK